MCIRDRFTTGERLTTTFGTVISMAASPDPSGSTMLNWSRRSFNTVSYTHPEVVNGLLYVDPEARALPQQINTADQPLNALGASELCPGSAALPNINASLRL